MQIETFYDPRTYTLTYVVYDSATRDAVIIDPVLDFDPLGASTELESVRRLEAFVGEKGLHVHFILETHAHADHLSSSQFLKNRFGAQIAIGEKITTVQDTFRDIFGLGEDFPVDGSQFDRLLKDGETFRAGSIEIEVIATPGHTPACVTYRIGDAIFTGDALFIEDMGTGRCDFPNGSADDLYVSVHDKLYHLPDETRVFVGHDYQPGGRELRWETTLGAEKTKNIQLRADTTRQEFVKFRTERDATLAPPKLLYPSVQVNIDAGRLPPVRANGRRYLHIPLNLGEDVLDDGTPAAAGERKASA